MGTEIIAAAIQNVAGRRRALACATGALGLSTILTAPAYAFTGVTISTLPTLNMSCTSGVCTPTSRTGTLNVNDLENMLASGSVTVKTGRTNYIVVATSLGWSSSYLLTLDSRQTILVQAPISVSGGGGLALLINDGGQKGVLSFQSPGQISFASLSSSLSINGTAYTLVASIASLASGIKSSPAGNYALASPYDASGDGTYTGAPIATALTGTFEGLGNVISNLSISDSNPLDGNVGLFATIGSTAIVENVSLSNIYLADPEAYSNVGAFAGTNDGLLRNVAASGAVGGTANTSMGGLVGLNNGTITGSASSVAVTVAANRNEMWIGGLAGENTGNIAYSNATGAVQASGPHAVIGGLVGFNGSTVGESWASGAVTGGNQAFAGGLVGANGGAIENAYAMGNIVGGTSAYVGGLAGVNFGPVLDAYSTGAPSGSGSNLIGGLIGDDQSVSGSLKNTYWDTTTSGISNSTQGAGNIASDPGITAMTTAQLQSALPTGFLKTYWGENSTTNNGLPYLLDNLP